MPEKNKKAKKDKKAQKGKKSGKRKVPQGSVVYWDKTKLRTTFVSEGQLTVTIPKQQLAKPGVIAVELRNPDGRISNTACFTIKKRPEENSAAGDS